MGTHRAEGNEMDRGQYQYKKKRRRQKSDRGEWHGEESLNTASNGFLIFMERRAARAQQSSE